MAREGTPTAPTPTRTIPSGLDEPLAAIVTVVRAQHVALALARHCGLAPDTPHGRCPVTLTTCHPTVLLGIRHALVGDVLIRGDERVEDGRIGVRGCAVRPCGWECADAAARAYASSVR